MRTIIQGSLIIVLTIVLSTSAIAGGGWVKAKGKGYYKFGQSWVESVGYFSGGNNYSPSLNSNLLTTSLYLEHGFAKGLSVEFYLPAYVHHSAEGTILEDGVALKEMDSAAGIGDPNLGLRMQLVKKDFFALSSTLTLGLPFGSATLGKRGNLFTGDEEFNQSIRLDASVPFGTKKIAGYGTVYGGFNNRNSPFSNEYMYGAEAGISMLSSRLWLISRIIGVEPTSTSSSVIEFTNNFSSSMSFTNYMIESAFYFDDKSGFSVSYTGSISGNVLLVAPTYSLGVFLDIN